MATMDVKTRDTPATWLAFAACGLIASACAGGDVEFHRSAPDSGDTVASDTQAADGGKIGRAPPKPVEVVLPVAAQGYQPTVEQTEKWHEKLKTNEQFNELKVRAEARQAPATVTEAVQVEPTRLRIPKAGNEALLSLKPGDPFIGKPADVNSRRAGKSNNVLGFMRKVKSVTEKDGEIVVETEQAHLEDILIGAASLEFPQEAAELDIGDEVNLNEVIPGFPPPLGLPNRVEYLNEARRWESPRYAYKRGGIGGEFGIDWKYDYDQDLLDLNETIKIGASSITIKAKGDAKVSAELAAKAILKVDVGLSWTKPYPHVTYFFGGAYLKAAFDIAIDVLAQVTVAVPVGGDKDKEEDKGKKALADAPIAKPTGGKPSLPGGNKPLPGEFTLGQPKYYTGPTLGGIPTQFVLALVGKCMFEINGTLDATAKANLGFEATYGAEYSDGNWGTKEGADFSKSFEWKLRSVGGGARITCAVGPRLDWIFAGVGGPWVNPKVGLRGGAQYEPVCPHPGKIAKPVTPQGKINASIEIGVIATIGVGIDIVIWSKQWAVDLVEKWWTLWADSFGVSFGYGECETHCANGKQDDYETGVDCGGKPAGGACKACAVGDACKTNDDCDNGYLCSGGKCGFINCQTGKKEDYMSDVNCGGKCSTAGYACPIGGKCDKSADCESQLCEWGKCGPPQCNNGVRDWWEGGIDCGGKYCPKCGHGKTCKNHDDCYSGKCVLFNMTQEYGFGVCGDPNLNYDMYFSSPWAKKGDMTDVMCGGLAAQVTGELTDKACTYGPENLLSDKKCGIEAMKCGIGKKCGQGSDCLSGYCVDGICDVLKCNDGVKQSYETDVDCGGWCNKGCAMDKQCKVVQDCLAPNECVPATIGGGKVCAPCGANNAQDLGESDVDCGGQCPSTKVVPGKCLLGKKCQGDVDCKAGHSDTWEGKPIEVTGVACQAGICKPICQNGVFDKGFESDVDCGGICAKKCKLGQGCGVAKDCDTKACFTGKCFPTCVNGAKDEDEAGIDCGGVCENKCQNGQTCTKDGDCAAGMCLKGVCGFDPCLDKKKSSGEGDVDCGGNCPNKCAVSKGCLADKDCASSFCDGTVCVADSCTDKKQSGGETDVDCGGSCKAVAVCGDGKQCKAGADCQSKICSASGKCVKTTCEDGIMSAAEPDIDCGGGCALKCLTGKGCKSSLDCDSKVCDGKVCVADACLDQKLSPGETDLDCGGPCSKKCSSGHKCLASPDCASAKCSTAGLCVNSACDDGKLSAGEADLDCGGVCATPCLTGKACKGGADCASKVCAATSLVCVNSACEDEIVDGMETDVDCGGGCKKACGIAKGCKVGGDCVSGFCDGAKCVASACETKIKDGDETGIDCGGSCTKACAVGVGCKVDKDCVSGFCDAKGLTCVATQCEDNHLDPGEADVDCGGACQKVKTCGLDQGCKDGADCASAICSAAGKCVKSTCDDGKLTANETGIDCGGACAQKCTAGQGCKANSDCDAGFCSAKGLCVGGACEDGKLSAGETDLDCGGPCSAKCATTKGCKVADDCTSGWCDGTTCQATSCTDKAKDGKETDLDCGGDCPKCAATKTCATASDCQSGSCAVKSLVCVADACADEAKNGAETDVDCGGSCAKKCSNSAGCKINTDCQSGFCDGKQCVDDPCKDGQKDFGETDVDCGGACTTKCGLNAGCSLAADCASAFCNGLKCVATSCENNKADFGESDVDCGKVCSAKCAQDKTCATGADCVSGTCALVSKVCVVDLCKDETQTVNADPAKTESDIDCGGPCSQKCSIGKGCKAGVDCGSGYCDGSQCVADHCSDKVKNEGETDVDCGGTCTKGCAVGATCAAGKDCSSTFCGAVSLSCAASQCSDEAKDGDETDVDCGGKCGSNCALGKGCGAGTDCATTFCAAKAKQCVASACKNEVKDGAETGVDCGGNCGGCPDGASCAQHSECLSGLCYNQVNPTAEKFCGCPNGYYTVKVDRSGKPAVLCAAYTGWGAYYVENAEKFAKTDFTSELYSSTWSQAEKYCDNYQGYSAAYDDYRIGTVAEWYARTGSIFMCNCGSTCTVTGVNRMLPYLLQHSPDNKNCTMWNDTTKSMVKLGYFWLYDKPAEPTGLPPGQSGHYAIDCSTVETVRSGCRLVILPDTAAAFPYCVHGSYAPHDANGKGQLLPVPAVDRMKLAYSGAAVQDQGTWKQYYTTGTVKLSQLGGTLASIHSYCTSLTMGGKQWWPMYGSHFGMLMNPRLPPPFCDPLFCNFQTANLSIASYTNVNTNGVDAGSQLHWVTPNQRSFNNVGTDHIVRCWANPP